MGLFELFITICLFPLHRCKHYVLYLFALLLFPFPIILTCFPSKRGMASAQRNGQATSQFLLKSPWSFLAGGASPTGSVITFVSHFLQLLLESPS